MYEYDSKLKGTLFGWWRPLGIRMCVSIIQLILITCVKFHSYRNRNVEEVCNMVKCISNYEVFFMDVDG